MVEGKVVYEQIDSVPGTKGELFVRSKTWLVNVFKSAKDIIQLDDKEAGKLMGKGVDTYYFEEGFNKWPVTSNIYFTLQMTLEIIRQELGFLMSKKVRIEKVQNL